MPLLGLYCLLGLYLTIRLCFFRRMSMHFYKNLIVNPEIFDESLLSLNKALHEYKVVHISPVENASVDYYKFYNRLTEGLGKCQEETEDGRANTIVDGKWLEVGFDPRIQGAFRHSKNHQPLHTDFSYVVPTPDFTLMYCVNKAPSGGETVFIDGPHVQSLLQKQAPDLYQALSLKPYKFKKSFKNGVKKRVKKIIDDSVDPLELNWNYYCIDRDQPAEDVETLEQFQRFLEENVMFKHAKGVLLEPNEAVIWHDSLILHGRNAYEATKLADRLLMKTQIFWNEAP